MDGKPLYRKVFVDTMPTIINGTNATKNIVSSLGIPFDTVVKIDGCAKGVNGFLPFSYTTVNEYRTVAYITNNADRLTIRSNVGDSSEQPVVIILEYTKSTD